METETTTQELKTLKLNFGKRLLLMAFFTISFGIMNSSAQVPAAPVSYVVPNTTSTSFIAYWFPDSVSSTIYYLDVATDSTFSNIISGYNNLNVGSVTDYSVTGLTPNVCYYYRLRASNIHGTSLNSNTIFVNNCNITNYNIVITSPINGATINNRCDLQFCVYDSLGSASSQVFITTDSMVWVASSGANGGHSYCLNNYSPSMNFTSGMHTFYLQADNIGIVDSVTVTIANPITDLCSGLTFSQTALTNGDYNFSVTGLNPSESYILHLDLNNATEDSVVITNATSGNIIHHYPHNGTYYQGMSLHACNGEGCGVDSITVNITNSNCTAYTSRLDSMFQYPYNFCFGGSTGAMGTLEYHGLSTNGTSSVIVNWGDGVTDTYPVPHNGYTDSSFWFSQDHIYAAPGIYSTKLTFYDAGACYNDSVIGTINISGLSCGNLTGTVYADQNNNCTQDIGEQGVANIEVTATGGGATYAAWTDYYGNYGFWSLPTGTYTIQINNLNVGYSIVCSNSLAHSVTITSTPSVANFALTCSASFDVAVTGISLMSGFYPGVGDAILPHVGIFNAACNLIIPGQVKMILSPCIQYTTSGYSWFNNPPTTVIPASTGDTLVWNVSDINNIGTFSYWDYAVNITTCTSAHVGDTVCITMMVLPTAGDADLSNNTFTRCFAIGVSYDPNFKEVTPAGATAQGFIPPSTPDLTYTINFQNTGTAVARNIYVMDSIDSHLTISSIEILSASHGMHPYLLPNNTMKFMFANIMLADSTHDKARSHGYVTYKIKLNQGLTGGTEIKNTGHIYFDYNEPVATNTTINTITSATGINEINKQGILKVYPNPAKDKLIVSVSKNGNSTIGITDILGKAVKSITTTELQTAINVSDLESGVYFIKLTQDGTSYVEKFIISK
jgi:hypothetical protein